MLVHSTALRVHQPFDTVMANSGVKTRSSEQTMLSNEAVSNPVPVDTTPSPPQSTQTRAVSKGTAVPKARGPPL